MLGVSFRGSEAGLGGFRGWRGARLGLVWGVGVRQLRCLARLGDSRPRGRGRESLSGVVLGWTAAAVASVQWL